MKVVPFELAINEVMPIGDTLKIIETVRSTGFVSLLVTTSAGTLIISFEVSDDGITFHVPVDTDDNALNILTPVALGPSTKWISFGDVVARFKRFKFTVADAPSTVSATFRQTEDN